MRVRPRSPRGCHKRRRCGVHPIPLTVVQKSMSILRGKVHERRIGLVQRSMERLVGTFTSWVAACWPRFYAPSRLHQAGSCGGGLLSAHSMDPGMCGKLSPPLYDNIRNQLLPDTTQCHASGQEEKRRTREGERKIPLQCRASRSFPQTARW
jgi:hypothetical protein